MSRSFWLGLTVATATATACTGCKSSDYAEGSAAPATAGSGARLAAQLKVDCRAQPAPISPLIYGVAYDIQSHKDTYPFEMGITARRWGGNHTSRYNWKHGRAWNTAQDWYFRNVNYTDDDSFSYERFLDENRSRNVFTALTVPMLGWVAKDTSSVGFPASKYPEQRGFDPWNKHAGDGFGKNGKPLPSLPPSQTSIPAPPEFAAEWVKAIREKDAKRGRSVGVYILDNEPMLWAETHRDVHPEHTGYDELLDKTIRYGTAIRKADPEGLIAGPAEWGWSAYFYSSIDLAAGTFRRPDRRKHDDMPLLPWYLSKLREHEKKTGVRILDVLDVHYYPQGEGLGLKDAAKVDAKSSARRLRSTRSLWDARHKDESWINEEVRLIPRMKEWIDQYYPGLKLQIGEYNFGAEKHMSGGLAQAEALGRFGQLGVWAAYMWMYPPKHSPAYWAFRAYRNFDGKGAAFEKLSLPTQTTGETSLFAARDEKRSRLTLVALNHSPDTATRAALTLDGCKPKGEPRVFHYTGGESGFKPVATKGGRPGETLLPPYSITVLEYALDP